MPTSEEILNGLALAAAKFTAVSRALLMLALGTFLLSPLYSQQQPDEEDFGVNAGFGMLIYQSAYNMQDSYGFEAAIRKQIKGPLDWQAGLRLGLNPVLPEIFGRLLLGQESGSWRPEIGLELGFTGRAKFEDGSMLLQETRKAMQTDINSFYMAIHTAPLAFQVNEKWKLSALEVDFGTHFTNIGRTLRAQVTVISAERKF